MRSIKAIPRATTRNRLGRANQAAAPSFATAAGAPAAPAFVPASSCVFFAQGRCRNGAACPFSHDGERPICVFYNTTGCNNGAACPFRHEGRPASAPAFVPAAAARASTVDQGHEGGDRGRASASRTSWRSRTSSSATGRPSPRHGRRRPRRVPGGQLRRRDPVAAAARAATVPVRPSNPRPMRGSVTTPTRPDDDGADARHELTEEQESVCRGVTRRVPLFHGQRRHRQDDDDERADHAADRARQRQGVRDGLYRCGRCAV